MSKEEHIVVGAETAYPLQGMLTLPDKKRFGNGPFPALVLVHGSGPHTRDLNVGNTTLFKDLAEKLAAAGIASIRYDKRTLAHGRRMQQDKELLLTVHEETVEDAIEASKLLKADARIAGEHIFLLGHGLGAMLAPRIDAEGGDFAGLLLLAGSPRKLEDVMQEQNRQTLKRVNPFFKLYVWQQMRSFKRQFKQIYRMNEDEAKATEMMGQELSAYYFTEMAAYPSARHLQAGKKPIFIAQGDRDVQSSIEHDFHGYKQLLEGVPSVTFRLYEGLNHLFMPSVYGNILKIDKEYMERQTVSDQVVADVIAWIHRQI